MSEPTGGKTYLCTTADGQQVQATADYYYRALRWLDLQGNVVRGVVSYTEVPDESTAQPQQVFEPPSDDDDTSKTQLNEPA